MKKLISSFIVLLFICIGTYAVSIPAGTKLYLTPHAEWKKDGARFAAYFFNSNANVWLNMTAVPNEIDVYEVTAIAGAWTNVIFCRMDPGTSANNWDAAFWGGQTQDLTYDGTKNHYTVTSDPWSNTKGVWSIYTPRGETDP